MAKKATTPLFLPCTPKGVIHLLRSTGNVCCSLLNELECNMAIHTGVAIAGKRAVVVGRSDIVVNEICRKLHACIQTNTEIVANRVRQLPRCSLLNTLQSLFVILAPRILNPL